MSETLTFGFNFLLLCIQSSFLLQETFFQLELFQSLIIFSDLDKRSQIQLKFLCLEQSW